MATPTLSRHRIDGALGPILIDVRAGGRDSRRPAVVVLHGFKGFKDWGMFPPFAERLARAGFVAVAYNASGSGVDESGEFAWPDRFGRNTFGAELADLAQVLEALTAGELGVAPPSSIGLVGHSRGGGIAVLHAARDPRVRALVTWASIASVVRWSAEERRAWRERGRLDVMNQRTGQVLPLRTDVLDEIEREARGSLDIERAAGQVAVPWLIVHGEADPAVEVEEARRLERASRGGLVRLLTLPGAGHTFGAVHPWAGETPDLRRVFDETLGWMARWLR
ncbi:MAG TPA: alpha/beta fold hydrolase [Gemmatimonadales bacterium]|nr:alpha/beta fold hydrolase [Gemmatimonadales bacterium]